VPQPTFQHAGLRGEGDAAEEVAAQCLLARIGPAGLEDVGQARLRGGVEFGDDGPHVRHRGGPPSCGGDSPVVVLR
jgi:hypothetical protein